MIDFLQHMDAMHWISFAIGLLVLELLSGGTTVLLWPAAAALIVGVLNLFGFMGWQADWLLFSVVTLALVWVGQVYVRPKILKTGDKKHLNERGLRMVGQVGEVSAKFVNGRGRVNLDDTRWSATSADDSNLSVGTKIIVESVDGTMLTVRAA